VAVPSGLAEPLRIGDLPVVGHVVDGRLLLDLIAVQPERDDDLADAVRRAAKLSDER
jgi:L-seryl-tRNA(Ser) seleniumtransferase